MIDQLVALILDESKWLTASMTAALLAAVVRLFRRRVPGQSARGRVLGGMSLFFGVTIGGMAFGHLLAVTTRLVTGTLSSSLAVVYLIGVALAVPSWWLTVHAWRGLSSTAEPDRRTLSLNAWLALTLLALGLPNLPLAIPGLLNAAYYATSSRTVGWAIVGLAVLVNGGLFVGSLVFLATGQTFEQFRGVQ